MTPAQCRAARAWLHWTQVELANHASAVTVLEVSLEDVKNCENGRWLKDAKVAGMRIAFRTAGIRFISNVGIKSTSPDPAPTKEPRKPTKSMIETVDLYRRGNSLRQIGIRYKITREAVWQRIAAYERLTGEKVERHE
jgi:hypothetical protein